MNLKTNIINVEEKVSSTGKKYARFLTSDGWMSVFDEAIIEELKKKMGQQIIVETRDSIDGKFRNIKSILPDNSEYTQNLCPAIIPPAKQNTTETNIIRQCALKAAVEYSKTRADDINIFDIADGFVNWILQK